MQVKTTMTEDEYIYKVVIPQLHSLGYPPKSIVHNFNFSKAHQHVDLAIEDIKSGQLLAIIEFKKTKDIASVVEKALIYAKSIELEHNFLVYGYAFTGESEDAVSIGQGYVDGPPMRIVDALPSYEQLKHEVTNNPITTTSSQKDIEEALGKMPSAIASQITRFLHAFPIEHLPIMTLEQYTNTTNKNYFTYWLEHETANVGGVKGGSSFKFGIFRRKSNETKANTNTYRYTDKYAWYARYGATEPVAFNTVLEHIVKTANCARNGQISEIPKIPLDSRIKWKIAFLYQDFTAPSIVSIYKEEALKALSGLTGREFKIDLAHQILIDRKPENIDVWSYSKSLWRNWSNGREQDRVIDGDTFDELPKTSPNSENTLAFETLEADVEPNFESDNEDEQEIELDVDIIQITGFSNDYLQAHDQLNIEHEVDALASIIAYKETQPPLSVGIFGEWGSGKSFYMNLLHKKIDEISSTARDSNVPQREYPFYKHIKQIRFNAWNYVESDLWASLAHTIYQKLYQLDENTDKKDPHWLGLVKYGEEEVKLKEKQIEQLECELNTKINKLSSLHSDREKINDYGYSDPGKQVLKHFLTPDLKDKCEQFIEKVGLQNEVKTINDAVTLTQEISTFTNRASLLYKSISNTSTKSITFALFLSLLAFIATYIANLNSESTEQISEHLTAIFTFFSTSLFWLKNRISVVSDWLKEIESIQIEVSETKQTAFNKIEEERAEAQKSIKELTEQIKQEEEEKAKLEAQIREAKLNLNELTPESVLAHHINETIGANKYGKFLGLPAILSKDFKTLSETIEHQNLLLNDDKTYLTLEDENAASDANYRINRIVLYIDDLDRCEPQTVVKVLEAVHLFLASPLFVVVLGVDPRWLFSSIKEHYASIMKAPNEQDIHYNASTPEEYLEKIFQIPIWLDSPSSEGVNRLITSIIGATTLQASEIEGDTAKTHHHYPNQTTKHDALNESAPELSPPMDNARSHSENHKKDDASNKVDDTSSTNIVAQSQEEAKDEKTQQLIKAQHHKLDIIEVEFINNLSHILVRSPRAVKRYLNIYRLIKSSLTQQEYRRFMNQVDGNAPGYKAVSFLLAVIVSYPKLAPDLINESVQAKNYSIDDLIKNIKNSKEGAQQLKTGCAKLNDTTEQLGDIKAWAKLVARYSYCKLDCL